MELTLYYMPKTRAFRVRWLLEELKLEYRLEWVDLFAGDANKPEYRVIHPLGQLPALKVNDDIMLESGAMLQWLAGAQPEQTLAPALDSPARKEFDQWMFFAVGSLEPPAWEIVLHGDILPKAVAVKEIIPFAEKRYQQMLAVLENVMSEREYLVNDSFTAADILIGHTLMWLPKELRPYQALRAYTKRLRTRSAYLRALQD